MAVFQFFSSLRRKRSQEGTMVQDQNLTEEKTLPTPPVPTDEKAISVSDMETPALDDENGVSDAVQESLEITGTAEGIQQPAPEETISRVEVQPPEDLEQKLKSLLEEKEALYDRLLRKQAEFENFRKRTEKEKQEFYEFALASFVESLLPVLDGLERSLSVQEGETIESYKKGMELILKQFRDVLSAAGVQPIRSVGKMFDPNYHQAVMREESSTLAENEIIEEYQRGYLFKERLLRPSMVKVAVAPLASPSEAAGDSPEAGETESSD